MKKIFTFFIVFASTWAFSQVSFNPGIRAGVNFAHFSGADDYYYNYDYNNGTETRNTISYGSRTDFYIGFVGNIRFAKMYALQPEVHYSRQGGTIEYINANNQKVKKDLKLAYMGVQLVNKFYVNKLNFLVGPNLEFIVNNKELGNNGEDYSNGYYYYYGPSTEVDLGITAGVGYDFTNNFGVEARVKKGFVPVLDNGDYHSNVVFQAGVYYTFNTKKKD